MSCQKILKKNNLKKLLRAGIVTPIKLMWVVGEKELEYEFGLKEAQAKNSLKEKRNFPQRVKLEVILSNLNKMAAQIQTEYLN